MTDFSNPTITVIVPVYKVEKYLSGCLDSILSQTFTDFEVICIDDGSPDNSITILQEYASKDARIKILRQENQGLSASRNNAMDIAKGDYIFFVDSDDYIAPQALEFLHRVITEHDVDIVSAKFHHTSEVYNHNIITKANYADIPVTVFDDPLDVYLKHRKIFYGMVWDKLYRKELLRNIRFVVGRLFEDEIFTILVMEACSKIAYMEFPIYYYFHHQQSISMRKMDHAVLDSFVANAEFLCKHFPRKSKYGEMVRRHRVKSMLSMCYKRIKDLDAYEQKPFLSELNKRVQKLHTNKLISYHDFNIEGKLKLFRLLHLID